MAIYTTSDDSVELALEPKIVCPICLQGVVPEDTHQLTDCKCVFCKQCMKQFLTVTVNEGRSHDITCPDGTCHVQGKVTVTEMEKLLDEEMFQRFQKQRFELEVELDPNRTFCPKAGCEAICHVCSSATSSDMRAVHCFSCGLVFCSVCKAKWHGTTQGCEELLGTIKDNDGMPITSGDDVPIKRCPVCHVPIERNEGCAQMMCKRCKHEFCWYCLQSLDDDFLLRHYDKGPCKNRLGHSRASVIWHRTQVVGIFAGFGVLMLLASPFLLLAAPCMLCCKCKQCHCCDETDDPNSDAFSYNMP